MTISLLSKWQETDPSGALQMAQDDQHNTAVCRAPELSYLQQQIAILEDQKQKLQSEKDKLEIERTLVQQLAAAQATNLALKASLKQ